MGSKKLRGRIEKVKKIKEKLSALTSEARSAVEEDSKVIVWMSKNPLKIMLHKYLFRKLGIKKFALNLDKIRESFKN